MNKTAIKNFAVWARRKLISEITYKAGLLGVTEKGAAEPLPQSTKDLQFFDIGTKTYAEVQGAEIVQRNALVAAIRDKAREVDYKTAFQNVVEEVAYTWFNRMIAIRFMEINDYLPSRVRVLSSENLGKLEPDFVTTPFDTDLDFTPYERDRVLQFKDENKLDELFRALFIKQCNKLHEILPELFEATRDYTELLLTISFTDKDGVVYHLTHDIPESDFDISHTDEDGKTPGQVEIIGWMYQYYNTEPKDEVFALLKKNVKITKERIPAATQLFTPDWIVRYMVENSLGRLWVEGHPNDALKAGWKYYLEEAEQEPDVQAQLAKLREDYARLNPEDIKVIDPCMGSGHILVYAFDVLMQIYEAQGYTQRDAARLIVEKNLYGLDIDKRAYQLAYFAIMMKARQYNRRILNGETEPNLYVIDDSAAMKCDVLDFIANGNQKMRTDLQSIADDLTNATEYGSIINVAPVDFDALFTRFEAIRTEIHMLRDHAINFVLPLVRQAQVMAQKYDVVVTNPPYMGSSGMNGRLSQFVREYFPDSKTDLFACFIERGNQMTNDHGYTCMVTMQSWMFLPSLEQMREKILHTRSITSLMHMENMVMGIAFGTAATVFFKKYVSGYKGIYNQIKMQDIENGEPKVFPVLENRFVQTSNSNFSQIPGSPVAYWASNSLCAAFQNSSLKEHGTVKSGMQTGNNDLFLRFWHEVSFEKIGLNISDYTTFGKLRFKWAPQTKGGSYRKWYGNYEYVVNFENDCYSIRHYPGTVRTRDLAQYFSEGITWTHTTAGSFSARLLPNGFTFNVESPSLFLNGEMVQYYLGLLNSKVSQECLTLLNSAFHYHAEDVLNIPIIKSNEREITQKVNDNIALSRLTWDSFETSWDFKRSPLV